MGYTLITGASNGIGYELSYIFAEKGNNLILVARTQNKLEEMKKEFEDKYGIDVKVIKSDLCEGGAVKRVYEETKGLEIENLVNNAGFGDCCAFLESDWNRQNDMIQLNIAALMEMCYLYGSDMKKNGKGRILNIASIAAVCPGPYMSVYYASKSFVLSFTEALAEELKGSGVTVTSLCPGPVETGFWNAANMEKSKIFTYFKPANAKAVAKNGYRAMMKGKVVVFHGITMKLMNGAVKVIPRILVRKVTGKINHARDKKDF